MHQHPAAPQAAATAARPARGVLATTCGRSDLELQVLQSAAGFYIGTFCREDGPFTRESVEYFPTRLSADAALSSGLWTQRAHL
nr:hypothetical protein [Variovorax boronicumulans]